MSTWANFANSALDRLGSLAPLLIIAALAAFGVYKLQEQNTENYLRLSKIAQTEREQARKDFETANNALKGTYNATNQLYTSMLTSMGDTLQRMQELETTLQSKQKTFIQSELQNERRKVQLELLKKELESSQKEMSKITREVAKQKSEAQNALNSANRAKISATDAEKQVAQLKSELAKRRLDLENSQVKLEKIQRALQIKRTEFDRTVQRLTEVGGLVDEIAKLSPGATPGRIEALRERARKITPKISEFLSHFAQKPGDQDDLDLDALVGQKLSDLRTAVQLSSDITWYAHQSGEDVNVVGLPNRFHSEPFIRSALVFSLSNTSAEVITNFLRSGEVTEKVANIPIARAYIDEPAIALKCIGSDAIDKVYYGRFRITSGGISSPGPMDLNTMLGIGSDLLNVWPIGKRIKWNFRYLTPAEAWAKAPSSVERFVKGWGLRVDPSRCLSMYKERRRLTRTELRVVGLSTDANRFIANYISKIYRAVLHPNQEFDVALNLSDIENGEAKKGLEKFLPAIAHCALVSAPTTGEAFKCNLSAEEKNDGIVVRIPSLTAERIHGVDTNETYLRFEISGENVRLLAR